MRALDFTFRGRPHPVHVLERSLDRPAFLEWLLKPRRALAIDTETTGLDTYSRGFRVRTVQFGDLDDAYVIPLEAGGWAVDFAKEALSPHTSQTPLVAHNATFDLLALDHTGLGRLEDLGPRTLDTKLLAHLVDPRGREEGGVGHGLKDLAAHYLDPEAPDSQKVLHALFRANGWTHEEGWGLIDWREPEYLRYAGADCILTAHLLEALGPEVKERGLGKLSTFEHAVASMLAKVERRGLLVDVPYLERLSGELTLKRQEEAHQAALLGVDNVDSPAQVAAVLEALGAPLHEKTATGNPKVDKAVLAALADEYPVAAHVLAAKRAGKFRVAFVDAMLEFRDEANRVHPKISTLRARTARMSISRPPFQQLPSGDATIRDAVLADPGQVIISADYAQVELRVLAALAEEPTMLAAIAAGEDLHDVTARALFGDGFTKAERKLAKNVGFGKVYGGGAATLARQAGVDLEVAKAAAGAYDSRFPGIKRYGKRLQARAEWGAREVITPSGRRLPLDRDRLYAATNYVVQSTARDILCQALLDLQDAGLGDHILLPIHDEVLAQAPAGEAEEVARAIGEAMTMDFQGVRLDAEGEVFGPTWGSGYR